MSAYQTVSDQDLVTIFKEGDDRAFTEVYMRYHPLLYVYAYKKLRNEQEAQDIIQEVLITLWNKRHELEFHTSLKSYLFTAVRNKALDLFSRKKIEARYIDSLQDFIDDAGVSADFLIRENDLKSLIEKEIQALPPRMREAFILSREDNLTHKEIGNLMTISEQTVSTQIKKALRILRVRLGSFIWLLLMLWH